MVAIWFLWVGPNLSTVLQTKRTHRTSPHNINERQSDTASLEDDKAAYAELLLAVSELAIQLI